MMEENEELAIIDSIQDTVILILGKLEDENKIFEYLKLIMENIEREKLEGKKKKEISIKILRKIIDDMEEEKKTYYLTLIDNNVISNAIDIIIAAASGEMEVNMTPEVVCGSSMISCGKSLL